ncbi:LysR substrate-binding domain-containing protein [Noviherbaspirillum pedocola]|uniref:LysR substrate-binding domain-containing protein n=1 Tax=Noviherbaspirillum pedocola TaxID=2801341 RepID=A0A934W8B8_9BURK|nr:LysR substrate-binding domain-containing protein [Noviherbaspirillum pedocola]MBK4737395.1 hypothetical protein [Noviherbaspirillum pedocola]
MRRKATRSSVSTSRTYGVNHIIPRLLERMQVVAPNIRVDVVTLSLDEIRSGLKDSQIDFSLGHLPEWHGRNIHSEKLFQQRYVVSMRANYPTAQSLTQKAFLNAAHAAVSLRSCSLAFLATCEALLFQLFSSGFL